ncbi:MULTISPECIES: hypothetical protein [unclassified Arthrobacter]|uniref:hypothetical protein n=1 Tax=unclassified Arthrobacter TaxID=235627 RepID=UPI001C8657EE|nr:hypothetical protein [Arthrobacter sp. MAHUQ-56]MBX7444692.1 hypothetical protein [Arthrobacter sp. MAHUQ-56]
MGKQRHDIGWQKRQHAMKPQDITSSPETMAARLVSKGLATIQILEPRNARRITKDRENN